MKRFIILFLFSVSMNYVSGQMTVTYHSNGLVPGDSSRTQEIFFIDPGSPGENRVWDFSGIRYTGKTIFSGVKEDLSRNPGNGDEKRLILSEDGFDCSYLSGENGYRETGFVNTAKRMTQDYSDPVTRMKYPFSYGDHFKDLFAGVAWYNGTSRIDLSGDYTVTADAFGTLILPDCILKNTLRVRAVKRGLQIGACGSTQSEFTKYCWFAPGYRYPVLMLSTSESSYAGKDPVSARSGWVNLVQQASGAIAGSPDPKNQSETGENSVIVFPNPFSEQVTYHYFLRKQVPVTVGLYDLSGKQAMLIEKRQVQPEGLHTGVLRSEILALPPGVYYLRFTFDKQLIISKIVKIQG